MSLTAVAIRMLAERGFSADEIADLAEANTLTRSKGAERQARYRARKNDVTRDVTQPLKEETSKPIHPKSDKSDFALFEDQVRGLWNDTAAKAGAKKALPLNKSCRAHLRQRRAEHGDEAVFQAIRNLAASPWHTGKNPDGWRPGLSWLLQSPNKFQEMLERTPPPSSIPLACDTERITALEGKISLYERMGRETECPPLRRELATLKAKVEKDAA